jgi:hypothetical protein
MRMEEEYPLQRKMRMKIILNCVVKYFILILSYVDIYAIRLFLNFIKLSISFSNEKRKIDLEFIFGDDL